MWPRPRSRHCCDLTSDACLAYLLVNLLHSARPREPVSYLNESQARIDRYVSETVADVGKV
jgi:hypothetical protein